MVINDNSEDGPTSTAPSVARGTYTNPIKLDGPIPEEYPAEFKDRPYIYVQETDGQITKVYRSYADYCD